jgi:hypothetical protein
MASRPEDRETVREEYPTGTGSSDPQLNGPFSGKSRMGLQSGGGEIGIHASSLEVGANGMRVSEK